MTGTSRKKLAKYALWALLLCTVVVLIVQAIFHKKLDASAAETHTLWKQASDTIELYQKLENNTKQVGESPKAQNNAASSVEVPTDPAKPPASSAPAKIVTSSQPEAKTDMAVVKAQADTAPTNKTTTTQSKAAVESEESADDRVYLGSFETTYYCGENYPHICGTGGGITASGEKAVEGITVAADTSVIPMGTRIYIEGIGERMVQDRGDGIKGYRIDIFVEYHQEALENGVRTCKVWMLP